MANVPNIYKDPGLTQPFDSAVDTLPATAISANSGDGVFYFGSDDDTIKIQALSSPGINPITIGIVDASPGSGAEVADITLALVPADLNTNTPGAVLNLPATVNGGVASAVTVHYRWTNNTGSGTYTDVSLQVSDRVESAI